MTGNRRIPHLAELDFRCVYPQTLHTQSGLSQAISTTSMKQAKLKRAKKFYSSFLPTEIKLLWTLCTGRGQLSNTHTYYLNQFYLRISYIDKSYKKHPNTELQQTAFIWISYRQKTSTQGNPASSGVSFATTKKTAHKAHHELGVPPSKAPPSIHVTTLTGSLKQKKTHTIQHSQQSWQKREKNTDIHFT